MTSASSVLSNTLVYSGLGRRDNKDVHVIAYQNTANNTSSKPNSMILPFPTSVEMTEDNIIDTRAFPKFLKNITNATKIQGKMLGGSRGIDNRISLGWFLYNCFGYRCDAGSRSS
jgi:hypothetical protein